VNALNRDHSWPSTLLKLMQCWLSYGLLWWLMKLLRVHVAAASVWRSVVWPVLLGQFWRPRWYITVGAAMDSRKSVQWQIAVIQCVTV
jgi:hypothetical protein